MKILEILLSFIISTTSLTFTYTYGAEYRNLLVGAFIGLIGLGCFYLGLMLTLNYFDKKNWL